MLDSLHDRIPESIQLTINRSNEMGYTKWQKFKMFICLIFNHFPTGEWQFNGKHANCKCCGKVISKNLITNKWD